MPKTRSYRKRRIHRGGNASTYVESVVGPLPHTAQPGTNVIAQRVPITGGAALALSPGLVAPVVAPVAPKVVGGKKHKKTHTRKGGNVLSELAVPAVLLIANQKFGKRTTHKKRFSRKYRNKRRF